MTPVTLRSLRKTFGNTVAVDDVDLEIEAGSLFFLLGPSGCGKTTLLRMIAGFTEPTAGTLHFGGHDVTHQPANKRNCGMVFQGYALWPHLSVRQNVAFGLEVRKTAKPERHKRVDAALAMVHMSEYADRKPNQLSGGQQQRVALARALVVEPTVLLLDEPLSNLDAKLRLEMRVEIKRICKEAGITAIYVTHDQKEALSMADHIAVLHEGRLVQVDSPRGLYHRPCNRFVADFLGESNFVKAKVVQVAANAVALDCSAGRLMSRAFPAALSEGDDVICSIRPEAVRWSDGPAVDGDADDQDTNRFAAQRREFIYLGETAQHHFVLGDGQLMKAFELNPSAEATQGPTQSVQVTFAPEDVVVLRD